LYYICAKLKAFPKGTVLSYVTMIYAQLVTGKRHLYASIKVTAATLKKGKHPLGMVWLWHGDAVIDRGRPFSHGYALPRDWQMSSDAMVHG
jgi:hypothetical protein